MNARCGGEVKTGVGLLAPSIYRSMSGILDFLTKITRPDFPDSL